MLVSSRPCFENPPRIPSTPLSSRLPELRICVQPANRPGEPPPSMHKKKLDAAREGKQTADPSARSCSGASARCARSKSAGGLNGELKRATEAGRNFEKFVDSKTSSLVFRTTSSQADRCAQFASHWTAIVRGDDEGASEVIAAFRLEAEMQFPESFDIQEETFLQVLSSLK